MSGRDDEIEDPFEVDEEPAHKPTKKRGMVGAKGGKGKKQKTGGNKKRK
jgi:hypothetical protein